MSCKFSQLICKEYIDGKPIDLTAKLISEFYYDLKGNQRCAYDCENNKKELRKICQYDKNDNKITETWLGIIDLFKWKYYKLMYTYDSLNRLESLRLFNAIWTLYFGHIYNYDIQGRLICDIHVDTNYNATGADSLLYSYDNRDVFERRSYSVGDGGSINLDQYIFYKYDKSRNLIEEQSFNSDSLLVDKITYHYNSDGLKDKEVNWDVKI